MILKGAVITVSRYEFKMATAVTWLGICGVAVFFKHLLLKRAAHRTFKATLALLIHVPITKQSACMRNVMYKGTEAVTGGGAPLLCVRKRPRLSA